jgi:hypothetical protein
MKVMGRQRMKIICKWLVSQFYTSEFNLVVDLANGEVKIKIPIFYNLKTDVLSYLYLLAKSIKGRLLGSF